jgi:hypothetical protein
MPQYNKTIYGKPIANILLNREKTKSISSEIRKETSLSTLTIPIHYTTWNLSQSKEKEWDNPDIKPNSNSYLVLDKSAKKHIVEKKTPGLEEWLKW